MITAAMATMATVDTRPCYPCGLFVKTYAASETARALASATLRRDEHGEVGVKRDPLDATNAKGLQSVSLETRSVVILTPFGVLAWAAVGLMRAPPFGGMERGSPGRLT